jgi:hypothetical protein
VILHERFQKTEAAIMLHLLLLIAACFMSVTVSAPVHCVVNMFILLDANTTCTFDSYDGISLLVISPYLFSSAQTPVLVAWDEGGWEQEKYFTINSSYVYPFIFPYDYQESDVNFTNLAPKQHLDRVLATGLFLPEYGMPYVYKWNLGSNVTSYDGGILLAQTGPGYYYLSIHVDKKDTLAYLWDFGDNKNILLCLMCTGNPKGFEVIRDTHWSKVLMDPGSVALANISPVYKEIGPKYMHVTLIEL